MEASHEVGVRRSVRLSSKKRRYSKCTDHLAFCFDDSLPPLKSKRVKMEKCKSKTKLRKNTKALKVVVNRLPIPYKGPLGLHEMPALVLKRMLQFLDVNSLENLAATCDFFNQLVATRGVTSLDLPFSSKLITAMNRVQTIHKTQVFRLRSLKVDDASIPDDEAVFVEYMISSQVGVTFIYFNTGTLNPHVYSSLPWWT